MSDTTSLAPLEDTPKVESSEAKSVVVSDEVTAVVTVAEDELLTEEERRILDLNQKYPRPASFDNDEHDRNPEERANFISTWLFNFMNPIISLGYNRPLGPNDLWTVAKQENVLNVAPALDAAWQKRVEDAKALNASQEEENKALAAQGLPPKYTKKVEPSLMNAAISFSGGNLMWLLFYQLLVRAESICSPLVLEKLLTWLFTGDPVEMPFFVPEAEEWGYIYVVILFIMSTVSNLCNNRFFYIGFHNYAQIRAGINALVYTKALRIASISEESGDSKKAAAAPPAGPAAPAGGPAADKKGPPGRGGLGGSPSQQSTGQIVNMMAIDSDKVAMVFYMGINIVFVPIQIAILIYLIYEVLGVAIFAGLGIILVMLPLAAIIAGALGNFMRKKMMLSDARVKLTNEILQGIRIVKFYAWEKHFSHELEQIRSKEVDVINSTNYTMAAMTFFFNMIQPLVTVTTFLVYSALGNDLTGSSVGVFKSVAYINALQGPLMQLPNSLSTIIFGLISAGRLQGFLQLPELDRMQYLDNSAPASYVAKQKSKEQQLARGEAVEDTIVDKTTLPGDNAIVIKNGAFSWSSPQLPPPPMPRGRGAPAPAPAATAPKVKMVKVLSDIDFTLPRGKLTAIVGSVGSGKSSLISSILEEMAVVSGSVEKDKNMSVAYVAQSAWIQTKSIRDNITFSQPLDNEEICDRYERTLDACALRPDLASLEGGDETEVGDRGVNLSGGQKQRVAIARAVFMEADTYIFDDPLSALDAHVAEHIFEQCFQKTLAGKTRLLVTNQLHFLSRCDYIYVLTTKDDVVEPEPTPASSAITPVDVAGAVVVPMDAVDSAPTSAVTTPTSGDAGAAGPTETEMLSLEHHSSSVVPAQNKRQVGTIGEHGTFTELSEKGTILPGLLTNYFASLENRKQDSGLEGAADAAPETFPSIVPPTEEEEEEVEEEETYDAQGLMEDAEHPEFSVVRSTMRSRLTDRQSSYSVNNDYAAHQAHLARLDAEKKKVMATRNTFVGGGKLKKGKQVSEEELNTGSVSFGVYLYHFKTMGGYLYILSTLFIALLGQAATVGLSLMLSYWSDNEFNQDEDFYIHGYSSLLGIMAFFLVVRGIMYAIACVQSSRFYHEKLFSNISRAASVFFDTTPVGRILNRFSKDIDAVDTTIPIMLLHATSMSLMLLGSIVVVCIAQPYFIFGAIGLIIIFYLLQVYYSPSAIQLQRLESNTRSPYIQHFSETLKGITTIRAFNKAAEFQVNQFRLFNTNTSALSGVRMIYRWGALRVGILQTLLLLIAGFIVASSRGSMEIGLAGVVMTMAMSIGNVVGFLVLLLIELQSNFNSVERLRHYTYTVPLEADTDFGVDGFEPEPEWPQQGTIEYKNVFMRYRPELPRVLHGLSFHIPAGAKVGVVGRTGSGKSSLMMLLQRLYEIESGEILIDGVNIGKLGLHRLRSSIGIVPQDPVLFSGTIRANLDPFNMYDDERVLTSLERVNLKDLVLSLPGGLEHKVTEFGANFSVGQRQLFCMARVLLKEPKILLLDEATSSVDSATDALIQRTIDESFQHTTKLIIAHRLNTVMTADFIMMLDKGTVLEFGSPNELVSAGEEPKVIEKEDQVTPTMTNGTFAAMYRAYLNNSRDQSSQ